MIVFPAIDLLNGQGVRLTRGAFDAVTVYEAEPIAAAQRYAAAGAKWLHIVDLNGARAGAPIQAGLVRQIAKQSGLRIQAGGGVRDLLAAKTLLDHGVERIVIGSLAVTEPDMALSILAGLGAERVVLAADLLWQAGGQSQLLTQAWQSFASVEIFALIRTYVDAGLRYLLSTDVNKDGMLTGASLDLYGELRRQFPGLQIIASGGVAELTEIPRLRAIGVHGVVVGKALYEGRFSLEDALLC